MIKQYDWAKVVRDLEAEPDHESDWVGVIGFVVKIVDEGGPLVILQIAEDLIPVTVDGQENHAAFVPEELEVLTSVFRWVDPCTGEIIAEQSESGELLYSTRTRAQVEALIAAFAECD